MIMDQNMNESQTGFVPGSHIYSQILGMFGGLGAIDCKDYAFYHGLISNFVTGITAIETGMLSLQQLLVKEKIKF
jgi:hypothetical protein